MPLGRFSYAPFLLVWSGYADLHGFSTGASSGQGTKSSRGWRRLEPNGKLSESLEEIGIKDPDLNVFYRKIGPEEYCVWFGTSLGESETYNSRSKKWE